MHNVTERSVGTGGGEWAKLQEPTGTARQRTVAQTLPRVQMGCPPACNLPTFHFSESNTNRIWGRFPSIARTRFFSFLFRTRNRLESLQRCKCRRVPLTSLGLLTILAYCDHGRGRQKVTARQKKQAHTEWAEKERSKGKRVRGLGACAALRGGWEG